ncbi:hypothetical protein SPRG_08234 [Saprolegnia parasitica CBS 223.65]|uniref:EGF-like domain-containing protein n=1 Tax=Saprolegnia parasitica (strain CBS 223.65) TaxID=695850 RepID=A0A067CIQ6_SAPPC|nr:hypothetical protein SPRG_08234 [Saprolegnia parasitica CBS 223.65]KDO26431.1 hypothetical protein SPRG_08234 [Saprolegnia parasitica CBS 223.65]|eukprot:XP_012202868.1 hypothetical protein SPRG_08234 [Saprolegnia parasitica CBS 223.65]
MEAVELGWTWSRASQRALAHALQAGPALWCLAAAPTTRRFVMPHTTDPPTCAQTPHVPKTYDITQVQGQIQFSTYTDEPVLSTCKDNTCTIPIGSYYNDVWSYDINCTRYADESCRDKSWTQLHEGKPWGGCHMVYGALICSHPAERWFHKAEVYQDHMFIYGGYGQLCTDYCDDMWRFNFEDNTWTEMAALGTYSVQGPGKRWKFSSSGDGTNMYIFGGYRIWHGFAPQNSRANRWSDHTIYPKGGYLADLWQFNFASLTWSQLQPEATCVPEINAATVCTLSWPPPRAGHASLLYNNQLFIHGGYQTFFPYPITSGAGAGRATFAGSGPGYTPFPSNPYYLDDLWVYDLASGLWTEITPLLNVKPGPRTEHTMIAAGAVFVLFGGYLSNYYYEDTWHFNSTGNQWLQQTDFVHALYPINCTDDLAARADPFSGTYQPYAPDTALFNSTPPLLWAKQLHYGTTTFSVTADPERRLRVNPQSGLYPQARRQAPGWDGCRDRADNRTDLPWDLQWSRPSQRAAHMAVFHKGYDLMLLYGGYGVRREELYSRNSTTPASTYGDWWSYSLTNCIKNCSLHGVCSYGRCICNEGYYGTDCSNSSCPGTVCDFDQTTQVTSCTHCCFSGFEHTDNDTYVPGIEKLPCTAENVHYSNGICDGFGQCICRPPFIGQDCSIRNCGRNCSGHGYCSVEFPNSRCLCDPGWLGKYCDQQVCLNNCSYPNGVCVNGSCYCTLLYEPYNNTLPYLPYMGDDCSFMMPFALATSLHLSFPLLALLGVLFIAVEPY